MLHVILGSGGSVGIPLAKELISSGENVRLVSRSGHQMAGAETRIADLTDRRATVESVKGAGIIYLLAGLPYDSRVWAEKWPVVMENTIAAAQESGARLIFFDNVYMYGRVDGPMKESTPYNPCSKKGEVRAKIATMLQEEMGRNGFNAAIARAADLYGPYATDTSMPFILIFDRLIRGKTPQWLGNPVSKHTFTNTLDCAKALKLIGENEASFNRVWHLPTTAPAPAVSGFIELAAAELDRPAAYTVMKRWMLKMAGMMNRTIYELDEMLYQFQYDYHFDSSDFNTYFSYQPRSYKEGISETLRNLRENQ